MKIIDTALFERLSEQAAQNSRLRQNHNLHDGPQDICQRLLNAMEPESYLRPHRHAINPKPELFLAVSGQIGLIIFNDDGRIKETFRLSLDSGTLGVEIPPGIWHTVVALGKGSVFLEVKPGPYIPLNKDDFAAWAPAEGAAAAVAYLGALKSAFGVKE